MTISLDMKRKRGGRGERIVSDLESCFEIDNAKLRVILIRTHLTSWKDSQYQNGNSQKHMAVSLHICCLRYVLSGSRDTLILAGMIKLPKFVEYYFGQW